jgi:hypothetical protein
MFYPLQRSAHLPTTRHYPKEPSVAASGTLGTQVSTFA